MFSSPIDFNLIDSRLNFSHWLQQERLAGQRKRDAEEQATRTETAARLRRLEGEKAEVDRGAFEDAATAAAEERAWRTAKAELTARVESAKKDAKATALLRVLGESKQHLQAEEKKEGATRAPSSSATSAYATGLEKPEPELELENAVAARKAEPSPVASSTVRKLTPAFDDVSEDASVKLHRPSSSYSMSKKDLADAGAFSPNAAAESTPRTSAASPAAAASPSSSSSSSSSSSGSSDSSGVYPGSSSNTSSSSAPSSASSFPATPTPFGAATPATMTPKIRRDVVGRGGEPGKAGSWVGRSVRVVGTKKEDLNGVFGVVKAYDAEAGRYHVQLSTNDAGPDTETPRKVFALKQHHLQLLSPGPDKAKTTTTPLGASATAAKLRTSHEAEWEKHWDPASGLSYFYNTTSGETTWEQPEATIKAHVASVDEAEAAAVAEAASAWVVVSESGGGDCGGEGEEEVYYYLHTASGSTSWQPPRLGVTDEEHTEQHQRLERWARHWDDESESHYWIHLGSGRTQWHAPGMTPQVTPQGDLKQQQQQQQRQGEEAGETANAPEGELEHDAEEWQKHFDSEHQSHYFVHSTTGDASWEVPGSSAPLDDSAAAVADIPQERQSGSSATG